MANTYLGVKEKARLRATSEKESAVHFQAHGHFALHIAAHSAFRKFENVSKFVEGEQMPS